VAGESPPEVSATPMEERMTKFTKIVRREVTLLSRDAELPTVTWVLEFGPQGLRVRRKGSSVSAYKPWHAIVGSVIVTGTVSH